MPMFYVEQWSKLKMHSIWKLYKLLSLCTLVFLVVGCKKEDPNPELRDPIYLDLVKDLKAYGSELEAAKKSVETERKGLKEALTNSVEATVAKRGLKKALAAVKKLEQKVKYYEIRSERRLVEGRRSYKLAFRKGERWPDPEEYVHYKANQRLRSANLNWNMRVPKLFEGNPNYVPAHKTNKEEK